MTYKMEKLEVWSGSRRGPLSSHIVSELRHSAARIGFHCFTIGSKGIASIIGKVSRLYPAWDI